MQTDQALAWRGRDAVGSDGEKIGTIEEIYLDAETDRPEWLAVKSGLFGSRISFIPIAQAAEGDGAVRVAYANAQVKDAPNADPDGQLSHEEEAALYRHYGLAYGETGSDAGPAEDDAGRTGREREPAGRDVSGPTTDDAMTRSEEEVRVGTAQRETGRVRLRKVVVQDEVTQTVPVRREEVRLEREPITEANVGEATSGPEISDEEHEVVLHEEEPVVEKRVVPKERVRLDKDVETEQREVSETARKEQIDLVEGEGRPAEGEDGVRNTDEGLAR